MHRTSTHCLRRGTFLAGALLMVLAASAPAHAAQSVTVCDASRYGAVADGKTKDTRALQAAIDDCAQKDG
jgi:polygalacturonase